MKVLIIADPFLEDKVVYDAFKSELPEAEIKSVNWLSGVEPSNFTKIILDLEKKGPEVESAKYQFDIIGEIKSFKPDFIVTHFAPITKEIINTTDSLKAIGVMRGGIENVDAKTARECGVDVLNTPGRNANAVAEFTVGMILAEVKNIARGHGALKQGQWRKKYATGDFGYEIEGKTVGLVGFGKVGQLVAKMLSAGFGCKVLAYDPFMSDDQMKKFGVEKKELKDLMSESDVVSVHARLSEATKGLIGKEELAVMKPNAFIINTARAGLIDKDALFEALSSQKIMGAALDVFWEEPIDINYPFVNLDNVTITPHYAGSTYEAFRKAPLMLAKEIKEYHFNKDCTHVINK